MPDIHINSKILSKFKVENRFQHCRTRMAGASRFSMEVTRTPTDILLRRLVEKRRKEAHVEKMITCQIELKNWAKIIGVYRATLLMIRICV